jgi:hypothetical protein
MIHFTDLTLQVFQNYAIDETKFLAKIALRHLDEGN